MVFLKHFFFEKVNLKKNPKTSKKKKQKQKKKKKKKNMQNYPACNELKYYEGRSENILTFCSFSKIIFYNFFKVFHQRLYTFAIFVRAFIFPMQITK